MLLTKLSRALLGDDADRSLLGAEPAATSATGASGDG